MSKKKYGFKGRYCTICQQVWEFDRTQGREIKYKDIPSYGLEREQCSSCKKQPKSFKDLPTTLARERHKKLLQRIADENQDILKNNVKKRSK